MHQQALMAKPTTKHHRTARPERVVLATFGRPHGVRGEIRLKSHAEDIGAIAGYGPFEAPDGRPVILTRVRPAASGAPDMLVATVEGVTTRDQAGALTGLDLSVPRDRLPKPGADDFYHADLIGLAAATPDGAALGTIVAVHDHGAGDILEIAPRGAPSLLVPFTKVTVPDVDLAAGKVTIVLPEEIEAVEDGEVG